MIYYLIGLMAILMGVFIGIIAGIHVYFKFMDSENNKDQNNV